MKRTTILIVCVALLGGIIAFLLFRQGSSSPSPVSDTASTSAAFYFFLTATTQKISHDDAQATVDIEYPELSLAGISSGIVAKINADIASGTIAYEKDFFDQVEAAQAGMAALPAEVPRDSENYRRYQAFASPAFGTVSILYSDEQSFPGDAHPANFFHSTIYDVRTGKSLALTDIVPATNTAKLYQRFIPALVQKYSLTGDNYDLTVDRLPQFSHFTIEDSGLHLYADQDSILAHVDGPADVSLPWSQLQDIVSARFKK